MLEKYSYFNTIIFYCSWWWGYHGRYIRFIQMFSNTFWFWQNNGWESIIIKYKEKVNTRLLIRVDSELVDEYHRYLPFAASLIFILMFKWYFFAIKYRLLKYEDYRWWSLMNCKKIMDVLFVYLLHLSCLKRFVVLI